MRRDKKLKSARASAPRPSLAGKRPETGRESAGGTSARISRSFVNRGWFLGVLLAVVTFLAYAPAWRGQPVWDDAAHLTPPGLSSFAGLEHIWAQPGATQQYYPLVYSVFWVEHKLWGDAMLGYHLVNILLHIA